MGLDIWVNNDCYYSHSYSSIHLLRLFAAQKEHPASDITENSLYNYDYDRFDAIINHSDCDGGYVPDGVPIQRDEFGDYQSSETLLKQLEDLGQYRHEMDEYVQTLYDELRSAAKASIEQQRPMEFC